MKILNYFNTVLLKIIFKNNFFYLDIFLNKIYLKKKTANSYYCINSQLTFKEGAREEKVAGEKEIIHGIWILSFVPGFNFPSNQ